MVAWIVAIPFAIWAVIRLFGLDSGYPLEAMMPFTPYVGALAVAAFALGLALRSRAPAALAAIAATWPSAARSCRGSSAATRSARRATGR